MSVEGARGDGMKDFLVVHGNHTFIMQSDEVLRQVVGFLRNGQFDHAASRRERVGRSSRAKDGKRRGAAQNDRGELR